MTTPLNPIHPSETLKEHLRYNSIDIDLLAELSGLTPTALERFLAKKTGITHKLAVGLEEATNISRDFWKNMQRVYDAEEKKLNKTIKK